MAAELKDMRIKDTTAVAIFEALGFHTAKKWTLAKLQTKMNKLPDLIGEDVEVENEKLMKVVDNVLDTIENGKDIIVAKKKKIDKADKKKKSTKKNADKTTTKPKKKDKAKGKGKKKGDKAKAKAKTTAKKTTGTKKVGVIATIIQVLQKGKPVTKDQILAVLVKRFPDREGEGMMRTINIQVPSRLRTDKGIEIERDDKGKYSIVE